MTEEQRDEIRKYIEYMQYMQRKQEFEEEEEAYMEYMQQKREAEQEERLKAQQRIEEITEREYEAQKERLEKKGIKLDDGLEG